MKCNRPPAAQNIIDKPSIDAVKNKVHQDWDINILVV